MDVRGLTKKGELKALLFTISREHADSAERARVYAQTLEIIALHEKGESNRAIGRAVGLSGNRIRNILIDCDVPDKGLFFRVENLLKTLAKEAEGYKTHPDATLIAWAESNTLPNSND